jgi:hypothetical protein
MEIKDEKAYKESLIRNELDKRLSYDKAKSDLNQYLDLKGKPYKDLSTGITCIVKDVVVVPVSHPQRVNYAFLLGQNASYENLENTYKDHNCYWSPSCIVQDCKKGFPSEYAEYVRYCVLNASNED